MSAFVEVSHVGLTIKKTVILQDINLSLESGEISGLVGRNGSGKTMLMKCICGFVLPTQGNISVQGKQIGRDVDFPPSAGVIIETPGFLPYLSGYQNLKRLATLNRRCTKEQVCGAMCQVGLDPTLRRHVSKYSLGMRQRLGIAQAIMEDPELLILDEPFNGLDEEGVKDIRKLLLELKAQGKTILISSHNKEDIEILCDQVYHMERGKLTRVNE
jgi:ABC-2 type transport system ATP-binding protein